MVYIGITIFPANIVVCELKVVLVAVFLFLAFRETLAPALNKCLYYML